jgi:hypothetical protein
MLRKLWVLFLIIPNVALGALPYIQPSDSIFKGYIEPYTSGQDLGSTTKRWDVWTDLINGTISATELGYVAGVTSSIQTQLDGKISTTLGAFGSTPSPTGASVSGTTLTLQPADATNPGSVSITTQTIAGAKTFSSTATVANLIDSGLTASTVPYANASRQLTSSAVTPTELGYVSGVTSALQTQIDGKLSTTLADGKILIGNGSNLATAVTPTGDVIPDNTGNFQIQTGVIVNADVNASAAIAYSKLLLTNSVVNADIASAAAIAYSKLNLTGSIANADVSASAAIAYSKLALSASIVNADIAVGAAIAYSKLALTGSIVNADISASAAIAYSKLNLATSIVNADISASAAIAYSKLLLTNSVVNADIAAAAAIAYSKLSLTGSIVNADINASAAIAYSKLSLTGSIVNADITNATIDLTTKVTGVLPAANVGLVRTINAQTGTTYTFVLADGSAAGGNPLVTLSNASAITATVPTNASVAFPVGTQIDAMQLGAGKVTFAAAGGVTINSKSSNLSIGAQYVGVSLIKTATNTWQLIGDLIP